MGLRICSAGEHPHASETLILVLKDSLPCVIASGVLVGFVCIQHHEYFQFTQINISGQGLIAPAAALGKGSLLNTYAAKLLLAS